jgi:hypothetical protein
MQIRFLHLIGLGLLVLALPVRASTPEPLDAFLRDGRIKAGLAAYADPSDNVGRFSLAALQTLDGLQQFSAGLNSLGINPTFVQRDSFLSRGYAGRPRSREETGDTNRSCHIV